MNCWGGGEKRGIEKLTKEGKRINKKISSFSPADEAADANGHGDVPDDGGRGDGA